MRWALAGAGAGLALAIVVLAAGELAEDFRRARARRRIRDLRGGRDAPARRSSATRGDQP